MRSRPWLIRCAPAAICRKLSETVMPNSRPAGVSLTPLAWRSKRGTPSHASRLRTCWLTAVAVMPSSTAAKEKLVLLAAASKARRVASGGSFMIRKGK